MREKLFQWILIVVVVGAFLYFFMVFFKSMYHWWQEWRTTKSLNELATSYDDKRRSDRADAAKRLDNGCEHDYDDLLNAFPSDVCVKCGLGKRPPAGECDHIWRRVPGAIPGSACESCGKTFGAAAAESTQ